MPVKLEVPEASLPFDPSKPSTAAPASPPEPPRPAPAPARRPPGRQPLPAPGEPGSWLDELESGPGDDAVPSLEGTIWVGAETGATFWRFDPGGVFTYGATRGATHSNGTWRQRGGRFYIEVNDRYAERLGRIDGAVATGTFRNCMGLTLAFRMERRTPEETEAQAPPPPPRAGG